MDGSAVKRGHMQSNRKTEQRQAEIEGKNKQEIHKETDRESEGI